MFADFGVGPWLRVGALALIGCGLLPVTAQQSGQSVTARAHRVPTIAAAASLNLALPEIARQFVRDRGARVELVFGASGVLTRQIRDGAPFELFLAADEEFPAQLVSAGLTRDAGVVYAHGRLAVFAPKGSPLVVDARLDGLAALTAAGGVTRFAIANPDVAPYGRAARAALQQRGLWDDLRPRVVLGDSVAQAAQFAASGNAVGGLLAYSAVLSPRMASRGSHAVMALGDHLPLRHRMVLLTRAGPVAAQFYTYLQSDAARSVLRQYGFAVPD